MKQILEISKMNEVTGRNSIKLILHEVFPDENSYNLNGISWSEQYTKDNLDTCVGMPIVAQFLDDDKEIPLGHGDYEIDEDGNVIFDTSSEVVGSINEAYVDTIEIDGETKTVCLAEGVLYNERYAAFVNWLKDELKENDIKTSIEIGKKAPNDKIVYADGWKEKGRVPKEYTYTATAILGSIVKEADASAKILECNENQKREVIDKVAKSKTTKGATFEMNALNYYDLCAIITRAFNKLMDENSDYWSSNYWIHAFYPTDSYVVMRKYDESGKYWKANFTITNEEVTLGEVVAVEEDWKPTTDSTAVEVDLSSMKEDFMDKSDPKGKMKKEIKKEDTPDMDEKMMTELNEKVTGLTTQVSELNESLVNANKALTAKDEEVGTVMEELNSLRADKDARDLADKQAEVNTYFETDISKNGFTDVELNSLKEEFVDKCDLGGLKAKEIELCAKKFKELNTIKVNVETNAKTDTGDLYMAIHNTEKADEDLSDIY